MSAKNRITENEKKLSVMSRQPNETRRDVIRNFQESRFNNEGIPVTRRNTGHFRHCINATNAQRLDWGRGKTSNVFG